MRIAFSIAKKNEVNYNEAKKWENMLKKNIHGDSNRQPQPSLEILECYPLYQS